MSPLDRFIAEHDISRLITRFALLNDAGDWKAVAAMFAADASFVRPAGGDAIVGRDAILKSFESRPARKSVHLITNILVDVKTHNEATARCTLLLYAAPSGEASATSPGLIGGFRDRLVRGAEDWLFAERIGFLDLKVDFK